MCVDAGNIEFRRDLLEHIAQSEFASWMNVRTSCAYIANKYDIDPDDVFRVHVQDVDTLHIRIFSRQKLADDLSVLLLYNDYSAISSQPAAVLG